MSRSRRRASALLSVAGVVWLTAIAGARSTPAAAQGAPARGEDVLPGDDGAVVRAKCLTCHGADLLTQQRLAADGWTREVDKMIGWGAAVSDAEKPAVVAYLARRFGPRPVAAVAADGGAALLASRCMTCHGTDLIVQQRLSVEGWGREVDKMIGWGAPLDPAERASLVAHLAAEFGPRPR